MSDAPAGRREAGTERAASVDLDALADEILPALIARLRASGLAELEVRRDDWRVRLRRDLRAPRRPSRPAAGDEPSTDALDDMSADVACSPAVGYFSPAPALRVGRSVQAGDPLGSIDVLGISQEVAAPTGGIISAVLAEAGQAVEYGQALAQIEPLLPGIEAPAADPGAASEAAPPEDADVPRRADVAVTSPSPAPARGR